MIGGLNTLGNKLSSIYSANNNELAGVMQRIATGKKINSPSDDFVGYSKAQAYTTDIKDYQNVKADLEEASGAASVAAELGQGVYEDLSRMKELADLYTAGGTAEELAAYNAEFEALAMSIADTVDNNTYEGVQVISDTVTGGTPLVSVNINPDDTSDTLEVNFTSTDIIADLGDATWHLDAGGGAGKTSANVQAQLDIATSYLVKAEDFVKKIDRQISVTNSIVTSKEAAQSVIMDIDEATELNKSTELQIRQQASIAMIAQSNMLHASVGRIYGG